VAGIEETEALAANPPASSPQRPSWLISESRGAYRRSMPVVLRRL